MANTTARNGSRRAGSESRASGGVAVVERRVAQFRVPVLDRTLEVPRELIPYYAGLGAMALLELIEWPVALLIAAGHTLAARSRNQALRELVQGVESGA